MTDFRKKERLDHLIITSLPTFLSLYFTKISDHYATSSLISFATDLHTFFLFLLKTDPKLKNVTLKNIPVSSLAFLDSNDIQAYLNYLSYYKIGEKLYKNGDASKARHLSALSNLFDFYIKEGILSANPVSELPRPSLKSKSLASLSEWEMELLIQDVFCGKGLTGRAFTSHDTIKYRDKAIFSLLFYTGLHVSELISINTSDIDFERRSISVKKNNGMALSLPLTKELMETLYDYISLERPELFKHSAQEPAALFLSSLGRRLSIRSVQQRLQLYTKYNPTFHKHLSSQKLRKAYSKKLYKESNGDLALISKQLGYTDLRAAKKLFKEII